MRLGIEGVQVLPAGGLARLWRQGEVGQQAVQDADEIAYLPRVDSHKILLYKAHTVFNVS
jgi:hypothetical protein